MELLVVDSNTWNHLTVYKKVNSGLIWKCYQQNEFTNHTYLRYAIKPNQLKSYIFNIYV